MAQYTFRFHFPDLDGPRKVAVVDTFGGNLGTALSRAWRAVRSKEEYQGIKKLRPVSIEIGPTQPTPKRDPKKDWYENYRSRRNTIVNVGG